MNSHQEEKSLGQAIWEVTWEFIKLAFTLMSITVKCAFAMIVAFSAVVGLSSIMRGKD